MLTLSKAQVTEIAELLDLGCVVLVHPETGEVRNWPDFDDMGLQPEEFFEEAEDPDAALAEYESALEEWHYIPAMESRDSFKVMEGFAETVDDRAVKIRLLQALEGKRPFARFKDAVDRSGYFRQQWSDYKLRCLQDWVREQAELLGIEVQP